MKEGRKEYSKVCRKEGRKEQKKKEGRKEYAKKGNKEGRIV